jgi:predicted GTPase
MDVVPESTPIYFVANKIDLDHQAIDDDHANKYAAAYNTKRFKVSAVTGHGLDDLFLTIAREVSKGTPVELTKEGVSIDESKTESGCRCLHTRKTINSYRGSMI